MSFLLSIFFILSSLWVLFLNNFVMSSFFIGGLLYVLIYRSIAVVIKKNCYVSFVYSVQRCFSRESIDIELRIENSTSFNIPSVIVNIASGQLHVVAEDDRKFSLPAKSQLSHRITLRSNSRGLFDIGPVELLCVHPLGFFGILLQARAAAQVIVYPFPTPIPLSLVYGLPGKRSLSNLPEHTDPCSIVNLRPYQNGDAYKTIHWKASARKQELIVKKFETKFSTQVHLILLIEEKLFTIKRRSFHIEQVLETAAGILRYCHQHSIEVGLRVLGSIRTPEDAAYNSGVLDIPPAKSGPHFTRMLEILACAQAGNQEPASVLQQLKTAFSRIKNYPTIFLIGPTLPQDTLVALTHIAPIKTNLHAIISDEIINIKTDFTLWSQLITRGVPLKGRMLKIHPLDMYGRLAETQVL